MIYATVSDAINSYLADFKIWALAGLAVVIVITVLWAFASKWTLPKFIILALTVAVGYYIATAPEDLAGKIKADFDHRSGTLGPIERVVDWPAAERTA